MIRKLRFPTCSLILLVLVAVTLPVKPETSTERDSRMKWWREARFGLFIHWGLYAIPAGTWKGKNDFGEWIRHTAQIPIEEYDSFVGQFNPRRFDARQWARLAREAGMKYVVITTKHHDGFCLFDSRYTDFDVMSTSYKRDIIGEMAKACRQEGLTLGCYYSIMDWHHPDYLPRRDWEVNRPTADADFERYLVYIKGQLEELLTHYGPIGVLWFDGEWENTWNSRRGQEILGVARSLQPGIIVNNRLGLDPDSTDAGGLDERKQGGDFSTPEQEVPATGIPGMDWETCMTMNDHWGYNRADKRWKSGEELIRLLVDIVSKGGNLLLNVGPTADGLFPIESVERLREIGLWMKINGEAIYGTRASPFSSLSWGRCTQKPLGKNTRLYLHLFSWPENGLLRVPGIFNVPVTSFFLADSKRRLETRRDEDAILIELPKRTSNEAVSVVVLDIQGTPDISVPPQIGEEIDIFIDSMKVPLISTRENVEIRYTLDGSIPNSQSPLSSAPIEIEKTTLIKARCFRGQRAVSPVAQRRFTLVSPLPPEQPGSLEPKIHFALYEGDWERLPNYIDMKPILEGKIANVVLPPTLPPERFALLFSGYIRIGEKGVYTFFCRSDDGSRLFIDDILVVDNDGLHGSREERGVIPLAPGFHSLKLCYFEKTGKEELQLFYSGPEISKQKIPDEILFSR